MSTAPWVRELVNVLGRSSIDRCIGLHEPYLRETDIERSVIECIRSGWLSTAGSEIDEFEQSIADFTGARSVVAVTNGTNALRLALQAIGVKAGDEVLVPALSFVASANAVAHIGGIPNFVDVEASSLGVNPEKLNRYLEKTCTRDNGETVNTKSGRSIKALIATHVLGHPCKINELIKVSNRWGIHVIEDAAEALGSFTSTNESKVHCGLSGSVGVLSFNGNKIITTGGGGAVLTNNMELGNQIRHVSRTAKVPHPWLFSHDRVGYNDRMPNINACIGNSQMQSLKKIISLKERVYELYDRFFEDNDGMDLFKPQAGVTWNYWLNCIFIKDGKNNLKVRNEILDALNKSGIQARPLWNVLNGLRMYKLNPSDNCNDAENLVTRGICLPSSAFIGESWK